MTDLEPRNGHNPNGKKRNFSIESILQGDRLKHPLKSSLGGHLSSSVKDSRAGASSIQVGAIVGQSGSSSEVQDEAETRSFESSFMTDNFRIQPSPTSSDYNPYLVPGLPLTLPLVEQQRVQHFDWINCTRYNPPKIPRDLSTTTSLGNCTPNELAPKKRKYLSRSPRIPFNSSQLSVLEERFRRAPYLSGAEVQRLANELDMSDVRVKIWFQNRRAREKRERLAKTAANLIQAGMETPSAQTNPAVEASTNEGGSPNSPETAADHLRSDELQLLQRKMSRPSSNYKCQS